MKISTSIFNANDKVESVVKLNRTYTNYIHIDIMDGKFVSNTSFNIKEIKAVNLVTKYPLDIHLMVEDPTWYIEQLKEMNVEYITLHVEIDKDIKELISKIKIMGYKVGLAIRPDTDIEKLKPYLNDIDLILVMSVDLRSDEKKFLDTTKYRVKLIREIIAEANTDIKIEVAGGITSETISLLGDVDIVVVGSYIMDSNNYNEKIDELIKIYNDGNKSVSKKNSKKVSKLDFVYYFLNIVYCFLVTILGFYGLMILLILAVLYLYSWTGVSLSEVLPNFVIYIFEVLDSIYMTLLYFLPFPVLIIPTIVIKIIITIREFSKINLTI